MKTAVVTDTNSGIFADMAKEKGIYLIPMPFTINGELYLEGVNCTQKDFFEKMEAGAETFTSQPAPGDVLSLWDELLKEYDELVYIPMSSSLSGSCQTAKALAQDYNGRVEVIDNQRISVIQMQSVLNAKVLADSGHSAAEIRTILEEEKYVASVYIAVDTLKYLRKSGRVTASGAAMATALNIKPVLQIQGGKLDAYKKVRGMAKAEKTLLDALQADITGRFAGEKLRVFSGYTGDPAIGERWHKIVQEAFPEYQVDLVALPLSICCHTGGGAIGVACAKCRD